DRGRQPARLPRLCQIHTAAPAGSELPLPRLCDRSGGISATGLRRSVCLSHALRYVPVGRAGGDVARGAGPCQPRRWDSVPGERCVRKPGRAWKLASADLRLPATHPRHESACHDGAGSKGARGEELQLGRVGSERPRGLSSRPRGDAARTHGRDIRTSCPEGHRRPVTRPSVRADHWLGAAGLLRRAPVNRSPLLQALFVIAERVVFLAPQVTMAVLIGRILGREFFGQYTLLVTWATLFQTLANFGISECLAREIGREPENGSASLAHAPG